MDDKYSCPDGHYGTQLRELSAHRFHSRQRTPPLRVGGTFQAPPVDAYKPRIVPNCI